MLGIKEALPCLAREIRDMSQNSPSQFGGTETLGRANKVVGKQTGHQTRQDVERRISSSLAVPKPSGIVFHDNAAVVGDPGRLVRA